MRQWLVNPALMCNQHLLGEHVELHMFVGTINKGIDVTGYIERCLLDIRTLHTRHEELVREMEKRGMHHKSPLPRLDARQVQKYEEWLGIIDVTKNELELMHRCKECSDRILRELESRTTTTRAREYAA